MYVWMGGCMDGWMYVFVIYVFMYSNHPPNKKENTNQ